MILGIVLSATEEHVKRLQVSPADFLQAPGRPAEFGVSLDEAGRVTLVAASAEPTP